ncbi:uncharacterized protein K452DRAFT_290844 [Aplosporella prunicola CBS 121167]|uniref:Uncharacterized protein n=1 Tax=Aplosporella prunicola CBS 121167 TaxID=1176127 RepID=A0A6A6B213_9PEZI|nr:uncharacterized protein K452DRAFT_290844 [Aplosporella prunicola CBS 121167]KAF2138252.1 hypothetical protein K452DRAFT_290844 [Aplosporella prunicola CBS 121167]
MTSSGVALLHAPREHASGYYCCNCGFGPMLWSLYPACVNCGAEACANCTGTTLADLLPEDCHDEETM